MLLFNPPFVILTALCESELKIVIDCRYPDIKITSKLKRGTFVLIPDSKSATSITDGTVLAVETNAEMWRVRMHSTGAEVDLDEADIRKAVWQVRPPPGPAISNKLVVRYDAAHRRSIDATRRIGRQSQAAGKAMWESGLPGWLLARARL